MYNADQKKQFILNYTKTDSIRKACVALFNALEPMEESWGADISTVDEAKARTAMESVVGIRADTIAFRPRILREYAMWCLTSGKPNACDALLKVKVNGDAKMRKHTVKSPKHLQSYLDAICDPESKLTVDMATRCYCWLAYAGMEEEDILRLTKENVHFENMVVTYNGKDYPLYREALKSVQACATMKYFMFEHPTYAPQNGAVRRDRAPGNQLVRGFRVELTGTTIRASLSRLAREAERAGKTDIRLSHFRLWLSGLFYRVYEDEVTGIEDPRVLFFRFTQEYTKDKEFKLDSGRNTKAAKQRAIANEYYRDYQRWKTTLL